MLTRCPEPRPHGRWHPDPAKIVALGIFNGQQDAVLLTPVPEPSTFVLAAIAMCGALYVAARRRLSK